MTDTPIRCALCGRELRHLTQLIEHERTEHPGIDFRSLAADAADKGRDYARFAHKPAKGEDQ